MIIKDKILFSDKDGGAILFASPENNDEIEFRIYDYGAGINYKNGGWNEWPFWDEYLESYAEWEAESIIKPIIEKYCNDFYCYTILTYNSNDIGSVRDYYMTNKRHLSWHDEDHFEALQTACIRLYEYDEGTVEQNIIEPILSDLLELDFVIENVTFYLYANESEKISTKTYDYKDGAFQFSREIDDLDTYLYGGRRKSKK